VPTGGAYRLAFGLAAAMALLAAGAALRVPHQVQEGRGPVPSR